ncbi:MAG: M48 family peptidase [Gammaproteobacteria bacterium]|nr:M48 family peptidase [Gammaproteobacteria bacterium]
MYDMSYQIVCPELVLLPRTYEVRYSLQAKRLSARVFLDGKVEIVVPYGTKEEQVHEFSLRHRKWIEEKLALRKLDPEEFVFPPVGFSLNAFNEYWDIKFSGGMGSARVISKSPGVLCLQGTAERSAQRNALLLWLVKHSRVHLNQHLSHLAKEYGFIYKSMQIRLQKTRWGSCSARRVISLNLCIIFQQPEVLRYLLLHELVHTLYMNHSSRYWHRVSEVCPNWKKLDQELSRGWKVVPRWIFS